MSSIEYFQQTRTKCAPTAVAVTARMDNPASSQQLDSSTATNIEVAGQLLQQPAGFDTAGVTSTALDSNGIMKAPILYSQIHAIIVQKITIRLLINMHFNGQSLIDKL